METLKIEVDGTFYMLFNLTTQTAHQLRNDPQELCNHFQRCLDTGSNICILENENDTLTAKQDKVDDLSNSSPLTSSISSSRQTLQFDFLCGKFEKRNYIYGVKLGNLPWHYFDVADSISTLHVSLPSSVEASINRLKSDSIGKVKVALSEINAEKYFKCGRFVFNDKPLKTHLEIDGNEVLQEETEKLTETTKKRLVFISGQTNPLLFLNELTKCKDIKSDKDKMYKLIHYVDDCHKGQFTNLYFSSDWSTVRSAFLKLYTLPFVENKKRGLNISFFETDTLKSFFELKFSSLSKFTTLPFINQVEMILNELPVEIASMFIVYEKMTGNMTEILDFCDKVQDLVEHHEKVEDGPRDDRDRPSDKMEMDIFNASELILTTSRGGRGRGRDNVRGPKTAKRGRPSKNLRSITEENESDDSFSFMEHIDNSSRSSWSDGTGPI